MPAKTRLPIRSPRQRASFSRSRVATTATATPSAKSKAPNPTPPAAEQGSSAVGRRTAIGSTASAIRGRLLPEGPMHGGPISVEPVFGRCFRLAAKCPAHGGASGFDCSAQHHLLGFACFARTEVDALAKAHLRAGGAQAP